MDIQDFSEQFNVRILNDSDVPQIYELCKNNRIYYKYCPPFVSEESICKDMSALPPNKSPEDKFYVGYFDNEKLIAVLDLIREYPVKDTVFIGFFMVDISAQNKGVGSEIIAELCLCLQKYNYSHVRLGWVEGNKQAESFWHKNGFEETGVTSQTETYRIIFAQRDI